MGCGAISGIYLENLKAFAGTEVVAVADLDQEKAAETATMYGVPHALSPEALVSDPQVEVVVNLTVPLAHATVSRAAIHAGKHVYAEKPFAVSWEDATGLLQEADRAGVLTGCAPDTVLGAGVQTCRDIVDSGEIGEVIGFNAFMMCPGHEHWHPSPAFYYQLGGGPLFDMGPYYLSCLVTLLGDVRTVTGFAKTSRDSRTILSQPLAGTQIDVDVPTHLVTSMEMASGAVGQLTTSFDTEAPTDLPHMELYGTKGSLRVPDPNTFGGPVLLKTRSSEFTEVPMTRPYAVNTRGLGVLDMCQAVRDNRPPRASGPLAVHVCEVMHLAHRAAIEGSHQTMTTSGVRPEPMPRGGLE